MATIEVGKPFQVGHSEYPECCEYNFYDAGHELKIFMAGPSRTEIDAVRKGKASFGLLFEQDIIVLLFQFEPLSWSDAPYSYWIAPLERRATPQVIADREGALLNTILIDASTGIVKAIRAIGLDTKFSQKLHQTIANQMQIQLTPQEYNRSVEQLYAKYPTTESMLGNAIIEC